MLNTPTQRLFTGLLGCFLTLFMLSGCVFKTLYSPPGTTMVAVTSAVPLSQIEGELSPGFIIDGQKAFEQAIPNTAILTEQIKRVAAGQVSASLKGLDAPDTGTGIATPTLTPRAATDPNASVALGTDPFLQYNAATALLQEVRMLNASVSYAAKKKGYVPYVLRIQINQQPLLRRVGFDTYVDLSFFTGKLGDSEQRLFKVSSSEKSSIENSQDKNEAYYPEVVPLLVTDNIEGSSLSQTVQALKALSLAIGASTGNADLAGRLDRVNERLNELQAREFNSLLTVGRLDSNTLRARLGARRQPNINDRNKTNGFATVPQTHYVTAVVLIPSEWASNPDGVLLRLVSRTEYRDVDTGRLIGLPSLIGRLSGEDRLQKTARINGRVSKMIINDLKVILDKNDKQILNCSCEKQVEDVLRDIADARMQGDIDKFVKLLEKNCLIDKNDANDLTILEKLWQQTATALDYSPTRVVRITLPTYQDEPAIDKTGSTHALLGIDDTKALTVTIPKAGKYLSESNIVAALHLDLDGAGGSGPVVLQAIKTEPINNGIGIKATFPSLQSMDIVNLSAVNNNAANKPKLHLHSLQGDGGGPGKWDVVLVSSKKDAVPKPFKLTAPAGIKGKTSFVFAATPNSAFKPASSQTEGLLLLSTLPKSIKDAAGADAPFDAGKVGYKVKLGKQYIITYDALPASVKTIKVTLKDANGKAALAPSADIKVEQ